MVFGRGETEQAASRHWSNVRVQVAASLNSECADFAAYIRWRTDQLCSESYTNQRLSLWDITVPESRLLSVTSDGALKRRIGEDGCAERLYLPASIS